MPSNGGSAGRPAGSASPIGRMPQDRSRLPIQTSGSTAMSSPSIEMSGPTAELGEPLGIQRHARPRPKHVALLLDTSNSPFQVRSAAMPSVSSRMIRSLCSGSVTSTR